MLFTGHLPRTASLWQPWGIPFTQVSTYPSVMLKYLSVRVWTPQYRLLFSNFFSLLALPSSQPFHPQTIAVRTYKLLNWNGYCRRRKRKLIFLVTKLIDSKQKYRSICKLTKLFELRSLNLSSSRRNTTNLSRKMHRLCQSLLRRKMS